MRVGYERSGGVGDAAADAAADDLGMEHERGQQPDSSVTKGANGYEQGMSPVEVLVREAARRAELRLSELSTEKTETQQQRMAEEFLGSILREL